MVLNAKLDVVALLFEDMARLIGVVYLTTLSCRKCVSHKS